MKKFVSIFTMVAFVVFSQGCYSTKTKEVKTVADWEGKSVKILKIVKTSGETIEFPKKQPGRIYKDSIIGTKQETIEVEIERANIIGITKNPKGKILEITTRDGKTYQVISAKEENDKVIIVTTYETITPLSDVKLIIYKKLDALRTSLLVVGRIAAAVGAFLGIAAILIYAGEG